MEHGFILYLTYEVREDTTVAQYYGRLDNGETFLVELPRKPYFYIRASDEEAANDLINDLELAESALHTFAEEPVTKLLTKKPRDAPSIRNKLHDNNIPTYEADIRFSYRQLIDEQFTTNITINGTYTTGERVDRVYNNPELSTSKTQETKLNVLSFDIETNKQADKLWSVALATSDGEEAAFIVGQESPNAHTCNDEKELLEELNKTILALDPDIITGWNVIDFDLDVLQKKYREHDVAFDWSRDKNRPVSLRVEKDFMRDSSADITGRVVLDGIHLLKWNFVDLDSYSLESAAKKYTDEQKIFTGKNRYQQISDSYKNNPEEFINYNLQDAKLVLEILNNSTTLELTKKRSALTGLPLDRVKASIASLDMVYLPRLHKRGYVAPTSGYARKDHGITGGFVMDSQPGIYDNILVLDFKSLYPSVMRTLNVDPLSYAPGIEQETSDEHYVRAENGACFRQEDGILPEILAELFEERQQATKQGDSLARFAIKILMNSFFGVLASPNCRFFSMEVSNAITHTGQHLIKTTAQQIQQQGYEVIYSDTDSAFVNPACTDSEQAKKIGEAIQEETNAFFNEYAQTRYCRESHLELEFEKLYVRFLMPQTRSGAGSKKRYAGLLVEDGEERIDVTGLELVRRDWTDLAKDFQRELLNLIFKDEDPAQYIKEVVAQLRAGALDDKLVYTKALRKPLDAYTKTTPPHVKAARLIDGLLTTNLIEYVQTVDGPEPVGAVQHSLDYEHYLDKQLEPIADAILVFYGTNMSDVLRGTQQKGLMDF